jgi:hypothetical protein
MAELALFDDLQKRWVQFDEDTEFQVSYLSKEEALELNKEVDKIVSRTGSDRSVVWNQKLGQRTLHGWRKVTDHDHPGLKFPSGQPIPYTPANRDMLMKRSREVSIFVGETVIDAQVFLEIEQAAGEETGIKNG